MDYSIRFAQNSDIEKIMLFIDMYWRNGHILARDRKLFEWQYGGADDNLHMVIGIDQDGEIQGLLGYVPYDTTDDKDIALALWKANPSTGFLGVQLIKYLLDNVPHREVICTGINLSTTSKIYEYMGMEVSTMSQWYRLARKDIYKIAKVVNPVIPDYKENDIHVFLEPVDLEKDLKKICASVLDKTMMIPYKSASYLSWRYINHPEYKYKVFASKNNNREERALFVFRIQECNGSKALRMVDCIGDKTEINRITPEIDRLMDEYGCEYVDTYEAGIDDEIFMEAGWCKVTDDGNIIPDYFAPFEHRKVDIHYSTSSTIAMLFKGDGDQDRPN